MVDHSGPEDSLGSLPIVDLQLDETSSPDTPSCSPKIYVTQEEKVILEAMKRLRSEAARVRKTVASSSDPEEVAAAVAGLDFAGDVVVTLGAAGAVLVHDGVWTHVAAPEVEAVDTTGAGDAFCGALAAMLSNGGQIEDAVAWAVAAGAYTVTGMGAQGAMPTHDEVRALLDG